MTIKRLLAGIVIGISGLALSASLAWASTADMNDRLVSMSDVQDGSLLLRTDTPGKFLKAPMIKTDVDIEVTGPIVRATVSQTFTNTSNDWVEGVYVFPLPEMSAVDHLKMVIGDRMIEGQIEEKQKAQAIYQKAKREGKKASLLTQERPNIFTNTIANIGPGETVAIQIEYQDIAKMEDGVFSLRFPMTVAPRFSPPREEVKLASADGTQSVAILDPVFDRARISPPLMHPNMEPTDYLRLPVSIDIQLNSGFDLNLVESPYHEIAVVDLGEERRHISLKEGEVPANRDFVLEWSAVPSDKPYVAIFKEQKDGDNFLMSMITPATPKSSTKDTRIDRETVFVIDTSGSMGGQSIEQARSALLLALEQLQSGDKFNIIRFSSSHSNLFSKTRLATPANLRKAKSFVRGLSAGGGTMMAPALETALSMSGNDEGFVSQLIFITDGAIGNERELFAILKDDLETTRLFPVAIGSAPNNFFMTRAAKFGRGTFVNIGKVSEVNQRMQALFKKIENPLLTNIDIDLPKKAETYPSDMPDLYNGQPVIMVTKLPGETLPKSMAMSGQRADALWNREFSTDTGQTGSGLDVLWARRKIRDLEDQRFDRSKAAIIDTKILKTALQYHIISRLTSLVAVDITPSRPMGETLQTQNIQTQLPHGWDFAVLTGQAKRSLKSASPAPLPRSSTPSSVPITMPKTASPHMFLILLGALIMSLGKMLRRRFGWAN